MLFKQAKNITLDGEGSRLVTHGEMTSVVIDESENITLKNLSIDAADPSVTEMTVESITGNEVIYKVHSTSNYQINGSTLKWIGEFGGRSTPIILFSYTIRHGYNLRTGSPTANASIVFRFR